MKYHKFILGLLAIILFILGKGCITTTVKQDITRQISQENKSNFSLPVSSVRFCFNVSNDGKVLISNPDYSLSVFSSKGQVLTSQKPLNQDWQITHAANSNEWLVWVESFYDANLKRHTGVWKMYLRELGSSDAFLLSQNYIVNPQLDLNVRPSISGELITWSNYEEKDGKTVCVLKLYNIKAKTEATLLIKEDPEQYIGHPVIDGKNIVFHQGKPNKKMLLDFTDVFLYKIDSKELTQLTKDSRCYNPVIYGDKIVWTEKNNDHVRTASDIKIYDLVSGKIGYITSAIEEKKTIENYFPSIGSRFVAWQNSLNNNPYVYDIKSKKLLQVWDGKASYPMIGGEVFVFFDLEKNIFVIKEL